MLEDRPWDVFKHPIKRKAAKPFTHVSLFSGCGGMDLGFLGAGFSTVFANDFDIDACETYRHNIGDITNQDIREVDIPEFEFRPDVLTAGFPCQPFSSSGARRGVDDERGTLYLTTLDFVKKIRPRSVVLENVRGLLSSKAATGKPLIEDICQRLDTLGYNVVFSLLDASQYNVPQRRLRLFIVGIAKDVGRYFTFPKPKIRECWGYFTDPKPKTMRDLTLSDTIFDIPHGAFNQHEILNLTPQVAELVQFIPEGGSWRDIPYENLPPRMKKIRENMEQHRSPNFLRRYHRSEVAGTISASYTPEHSGILHPTEDRVFSVRESARIQSFPDWFEFKGRHVRQKCRQIGNAVPPRLAYEIARCLREILRSEDRPGSSACTTYSRFIGTGRPLRVGEVCFF